MAWDRFVDWLDDHTVPISCIGLIIILLIFLYQALQPEESAAFKQRMLVPTDSVMVNQHNVAGLADSLVYYVTQDSVIVATGLLPEEGFIAFDAIGGGTFHVRSGEGGFAYEHTVCVGPEHAGEIRWIFFYLSSPCGSGEAIGTGVRTVGVDGCFTVDINPQDIPYMAFYLVAVNDDWTIAGYWRIER